MGNEELLSRITTDPDICHGQPCVRGLRYPVAVILEYLDGGDTTDELLKEFPDIEADDILACREFAKTSMTSLELLSGSAYLNFLGSGMTDDELSDMLEKAKHAMRAERRRRNQA